MSRSDADVSGGVLRESHWPADLSGAIRETTIGDALRVAAVRWTGRDALVEALSGTDARRWSFGDLASGAERVAQALLKRFVPGEHLAVWAANCPEWVLLEFGAAMAGLTLVTVSPAYQEAELLYVLRQSRSHGIIFQPEYRSRDLSAVVGAVAAHLPLLREAISLDRWQDFLESGEPDVPLPEVRPGETAQIQYTSGTTGFPKGALLTHRGLTNNSRFFAQALRAGAEDVWVNPMPLFHTAGCSLCTLGALQTGGAQVLPRGFDAHEMLDLFDSQRGTLLLGVPTMLTKMLEAHAQRPRDLGSWRLAALGGAPVAPDLAERAEAELDLRVLIGFGQTEASPYITHTRIDDPASRRLTTVGKPLPQTEVRIADSSGATVPTGHSGEIMVRGYGVMSGYFDAPDATAGALDREGWLHTGDLGAMDAKGYVSVNGRIKDMIIRGGENIYPREIEDVLFTHPSVLDNSVVGLPDTEWGEIVAAFVRLRDGADCEPGDLERFCGERLARYKVPRIWEFVDGFPQTPSGKVQKFVLRDRYLAGQLRRTNPASNEGRVGR
jgi:fatty-acyl-CoA synthase